MSFWSKSITTVLTLAAAVAVVAAYIYKSREKKKQQPPVDPNHGNMHGASEGSPPPCPDYVYDGIILYSDEDLNKTEEHFGVIDLIKHLKQKSTIPNLSIDGYEALPLAGHTEFDNMNYILKHYRYIFVYVSRNFSEDRMKRFQSQMCLCDVIKNNSWRVIPIFADKGKLNCPSELQLIDGLYLWHLNDEKTQELFMTKFNNTIIEGRKLLCLT